MNDRRRSSSIGKRLHTLWEAFYSLVYCFFIDIARFGKSLHHKILQRKEKQHKQQTWQRQHTAQWAKPYHSTTSFCRPIPEERDPYDREFEFRLLRARTEPMELLEFCDDAHSEVLIKSGTGESVYKVTEKACECEDFQKRKRPCKHMIFLAIKTGKFLQYEVGPYERRHDGTNREGQFVPRYWEYYAGAPRWLGYNNLCTFDVEGWAYGVSEKTGRQTNRKRTVFVNAIDEQDAKKAAAESGVMPPYARIERIDVSPTYRQYQFLHAVDIPAPYFINAEDISALLTRYEDQDDSRCPRFLFEMATQYRICVSYFRPASYVKSCIWAAIPREKRAAAFCYAVHCKETGREFGGGTVRMEDRVFSEFQPTEKEMEYIQNIQEFGWRPPHGNASAYKSAVAFLKERKML